jgi:hypothetical protein
MVIISYRTYSLLGIVPYEEPVLDKEKVTKELSEMEDVSGDDSERLPKISTFDILVSLFPGLPTN